MIGAKNKSVTEIKMSVILTKVIAKFDWPYLRQFSRYRNGKPLKKSPFSSSFLWCPPKLPYKSLLYRVSQKIEVVRVWSPCMQLQWETARLKPGFSFFRLFDAIFAFCIFSVSLVV